MDENDTCLIWGTPANHIVDRGREGLYVTSPRAGGEYFVNTMAASLVSKLNDREKARLTTWLIEQRRLGVERPELPSRARDEIESIIQRPDLPVHARADELLRYIKEKTPHIGKLYPIKTIEEMIDSQNTTLRPFGHRAALVDLEEMFAYTESTNEVELHYLLEYLLGRGWLKTTREEPGLINVLITIEGYGRLAELTEIENVKTVSSQAFVAMWFDDTLLDAWTIGIKPAIENAGFNPVRIDNQEYIEKIDDRIIAEIRKSRFIVADFTQGSGGARGGVYYEAGFAHGLNIPVFYTCKKDSMKHIHFDTRQYNHIDWESPEELRERLTNRISAVMIGGSRRIEN